MSIHIVTMVDPVAPSEKALTLYDREHYLHYARLIDADNEGTDWQIAAAAILECDVARDPNAARLCFDSHLARARWIIGEGLDTILNRAEHQNTRAKRADESSDTSRR